MPKLLAFQHLQKNWPTPILPSPSTSDPFIQQPFSSTRIWILLPPSWGSRYPSHYHGRLTSTCRLLEEALVFSTMMRMKTCPTKLPNNVCATKGFAVSEQDYGQSYEPYEPSPFRHRDGPPFCVVQPLHHEIDHVWSVLTSHIMIYQTISWHSQKMPWNLICFVLHVISCHGHTFHIERLNHLIFDSPAASLHRLRTLEPRGRSSRYIHMYRGCHLSIRHHQSSSMINDQWSIIIIIIIIKQCDHRHDNLKLIIINTHQIAQLIDLSLHLPYTRLPRQSPNCSSSSP